jgi:hypothetical protein
MGIELLYRQQSSIPESGHWDSIEKCRFVPNADICGAAKLDPIR